MFDIGFWELVLIAIVALLVVGPERLPKLAAEAGMWFGKLQRFIRKARADIESELHQYEIQQAIREQERKFHELKQVIDETGREMTGQLESSSKDLKNDDVTPEGNLPADTPTPSDSTKS